MDAQKKLTFLTVLLVLCSLLASVTVVMRNQQNRYLNEQAVWFDQYGRVVNETIKSVVAIETVTQLNTRSGPLESLVQNSGSGFIYDANGYIVTNEHVIHNAREIRVILSDKRHFFANVIGTDPRTDIAVLKIEAEELIPIEKGNTDELQPGQLVISIGNPLGTAADGRPISTFGRINGTQKRLRTDIDPANDRFYDNLIQIDAITLPGNSGGPLVNTMGQLIGITTAMVSNLTSGEQFGFALTLDNKLTNIIEKLKEGQVIDHALLGVSTILADSDQAERLGIKDASGALVTWVKPNSPAEQSGILRGDLIRAVDDRRVSNPTDLISCINSYEPDDIVDIMVLRGEEGQSHSVTIPVKLSIRNPNRLVRFQQDR